LRDRCNIISYKIVGYQICTSCASWVRMNINSRLLIIVILKCLRYAIMIFLICLKCFWCQVYSSFLLMNFVHWRGIHFWSHISLVNFFLHFDVSMKYLWSYYEVFLNTWGCYDFCFLNLLENNTHIKTSLISMFS